MTLRSSVVRCVLIGAGGHARVLLDALRAAGESVECVLVDADLNRTGTTVDGAPIVGSDESLQSLASQGIASFVVSVGGNGNNQIRRRLFQRGLSAGLRPLSVIHPNSIRSRKATFDEGCQILAGCIVNAGATIGLNAIINTGSIVEHDCVVGSHAHVATGARLGGGVVLGEGSHVGAGATVMPGRRVGEWAIVGAGAVVTKDVPPCIVVTGVPARVLRSVELQQIS